MGIFILITAAVVLTSIFATISATCTKNSDCNSVVSDLRFCDENVNLCYPCSQYCGRARGSSDVWVCHHGCNNLCQRLQHSATPEEKDTFSMCWKKLPSTTTPIPTQRPTPAGPKMCFDHVDNQDVCSPKEFCDKSSNSCRPCNVPCGQHGSFSRCQKLCPKWCKYVVSNRSKRLRTKFPQCWARATTTSILSTPDPQMSRTLSTTESSKSEDNRESAPLHVGGADRPEGKSTPKTPSRKPADEGRLGESKQTHEEDYGQITIYVLAPLCGVISIVCVGQIIVLVRRRNTLRNGAHSVRTAVVDEVSGGIPLQDMARTSGAPVETVVTLESE